jgi:hypothetical protein
LAGDGRRQAPRAVLAEGLLAEQLARSAHAALVAEGAITNLLSITSSSALVDHAEITYRSYLELLTGVGAPAEACV